MEKSHSHRVLQRTVQLAEHRADQLGFWLLAKALMPFYAKGTLEDVQRRILLNLPVL